MRSDVSRRLRFVLGFMALLVVVKVTAAVLLGYRSYFPPDFASDFLTGRESYFFGSYQWAFYTHIVAGPPSLILGLILISDRFRLRFPRAHRVLGRVQAATVLVLLVPSGFWMARWTATGPIAGVGFVNLSLLTAFTIAMGWRTAVARRFAAHRRWMMRNYLLLCSAVVLRVLGGLGTTLAVTWLWFDPVASWASWIVPVAVFEWTSRRRSRRVPHASSSLPASRDAAPATHY